MFIHQRHSRVALQTTCNNFFTIQTKRRGDVGLADEITGDLTINDVKLFLNLTRRTLVQAKVLGRFPTLQSAIGAASVKAEG
jgi:hypothetical protein